VAKTGSRFDEFLFWNFSGKTPCVGGGHSEEGAEDDGEPARWRSSAFVAVAGLNTAFKAVAVEGVQGTCASCHGSAGTSLATRSVLVPAPMTPSLAAPGRHHTTVTGVYLTRGPGQNAQTVLDTRTDSQTVDPEAPAGSKVTEVGIEREGLRGDWLAVSAKMAVEGSTEEEDGIAGVYITRLPRQ
jgi:hypothetical protein